MLVWNDLLFDDENHSFIGYKKKGVGTGHSQTGRRAKWKKKMYFEQDLLNKFNRELKPSEFKARFAGYSADNIKWFFETISHNALRPKESFVHARNKLLLWLDKLHNSLSCKQMKEKYKIGETTALSHINDILKAIIKSYKNKNVVTFPTERQRKQMVNILKQRNAPMPDAIFTMDGSHTRCTGRHISERMSHKYKWLPCFNSLFIIERVFYTICAFNLDQSASKHDITVLRESWFYQHIETIMNGWIILADKGYIGAEKDTRCVAAVLKKNMEGRKHFSKKYWYHFNAARADSERVFADFYSNKFTQLSDWKGKSKETFIEWSLNVICGIIFYNVLKLETNQ